MLRLLHQLHRVSRFVHDISGFVSKEGANLVANKEQQLVFMPIFEHKTELHQDRMSSALQQISYFSI